MKIALIAKLFAPVSKSSTGGTETFVYNLAKELAGRGHQVTLFASGDSELNNTVNLIPVVNQSYWKKYSENAQLFSQLLTPRRAMSEEIIGYLKIIFYLKQHKDDFNLVHDNSLYFLPLILEYELIPLPLIATLHVPITNFSLPDILKDLNISNDNNYYIAISNNQKQMVKNMKIFDVNYNGIDEKRFIFNDKSDNYLLWVGRIVPEKGLEKAIEVAIKTNMDLKIAGAIADRDLFEKKIKPMISRQKNIIYLGEKLGQNLVKLYQEAKILLFPIDWEEPFGLVMVEAMACGTPVVAFRMGSVPEIVKDGETGFICPPGDIDCMVKKVKAIYEMPEEKYQTMRRACRKHVEENFTIEKMVEGYEKVYEKVINDWKKKHG